MGRERLLFLARLLSGLAGVAAFVVGIGAGLSETGLAPAFWLMAGVFALVAYLCDKAMTR